MIFPDQSVHECYDIYMAAPTLEEIVKFYLASRDFNGLPFDGKNEADKEAVIELIRDEKVQVVADGVDYLNPHIRPWKSKRSVDDQIRSIKELGVDSYPVCLYPTAEALKGVRSPRRFANQPFAKDMAKGRGTLELAYFSFDVLEQYRNDPRFQFEFYDFGARAIITSDAYDDDEVPEHDKTSIQYIGFAYDLSKYKRDDPDSPVTRRVCAFYGDLIKLSDVHQQRWKTYQVPDEGLNPHPVWWASMMGHFPDGLGPFETLFREMQYLQELFNRAHGMDLFKTTDRPTNLGWILRPSQQEWDGFIQHLDKLLSENLSAKALATAGAPKINKSGQPLGTLGMLEALLVLKGIPEGTAKKMLKPLREIRQARQKPAHQLRQNISDKTFVHRQITLVEEVTLRLDALRHFWMSHPDNRDWKQPHPDPKHSYRM